MKKLVMMMLVAAAVMTGCSTDGTEVDGGYIDEDGKFVPKTEVWTVTIEPEYVMNYSYWGAYTGLGIQMEAIDLTGKTVGTFFLDEIQGFKYEEGYRYILSVEATTTDPRIADNGKYRFKLRDVLSKTYVGIRTEGQREVTMDVRMVKMMRPDPTSSECFHYLCGQATDGSETLDMNLYEIFYTDTDTPQLYKGLTSLDNHIARMRLSITPSDRPVFGSHCYRIRLKELISSEDVGSDSIAVAPSDEVYRQKCDELVYGIIQDY
jgi:hypothetical protein